MCDVSVCVFFMYGGVNVPEHMCRPEVKLRYLSTRTPSILFVETGCFICLELGKPSRLASKPQGAACLCLPSTRITSV